MTTNGAWVTLIIAGLLEIVWATALKQSSGMLRLWPTVLAIGSAALSFAMLAVALRFVPVGVGYAVWVGIGATGVMLASAAVLGESLTVAKLICLVLVVSGVAGFKLFDQ